MPAIDSIAVLRSVPLFASLTDADLERLAAQATKVSFKDGDRIVYEGDLGDRMWVILSGSVQIYTTSFDGSDLVLMRLEAGQCFGEQALMPGGTGRRTASVRMLKGGDLLELSRDAVAGAMLENSAMLGQLQAEREQQRIARNEKLRAAVFSALGVSNETESYRVERYDSGQAIFREGDRGERVYLLLKGFAFVKHQARGQESVFAELMPGHFFGELAVLHDAPRVATVEAADELEVASLDGEWFRAMHRENPVLQALTESLSNIYLMPHRGMLTLQTGRIDNEPAVTAIYHLPNGQRVLCIQVAGKNAFSARILGAKPTGEPIKYECRARGLHRELHLQGDRVVSIESEGEWIRLGKVLETMLDAKPVEEWQVAMFQEKGNFQADGPEPLYEDGEVLCACTKTTCGQMLEVIAEGCHTVEGIGKKTGATRVCGGCTPLVKELLGRSDWTPARVTESIPLAEDIRSFRLTPMEGGVHRWRPGQHLIVQVRIDNHWVQRAYTISSAYEPGAPYEITVKREPQGVLSRWLFERVSPRAMLRVSEPAGSYFLPDDQAADVVCLVSGIGITPALAMLRTLADDPRPFHFHLDYSVSDEQELILQDELERHRVTNPRVTIRTRVTSVEERVKAEDVRELVARYPGADFYLCGSIDFMAGIGGFLRDAEVPSSRIKVEIFTVAGEKPLVGRTGGGKCPVDHTAAEPEIPDHPVRQAEALLEEYYEEVGATTVFGQRWQQVMEDFQEHGTYTPTLQELAHLTKVAWRNSGKCLGRMNWEGLAVRDRRHVPSEKEMFAAIFDHIDFATNAGNIRPTITIFGPQTVDGLGPRIWNPNLIGYAGYRTETGAIMGDAANVELTEVAMALGWAPPEIRTRFDVLPIIVQMHSESAPVWEAIPRKLVLEVPLMHPDLEWFAELGLKWHVLPSPSSMVLDLGGVRFAAAPFSGWYVGSEIAAGCLGDTGRYDVLPKIARKLGLETTDDRTLWRDRALVELNVAVLHSFRDAGITISDHHSASRAFDQFEQAEEAAGRSVEARWNWLTPPISGVTGTAFQRDPRTLRGRKPCFERTAPAWKR